MGKMIVCKTCSHEIAKSAKACPHCGAKLKMGTFKKILLGITAIFALIIIIGIATNGGESRQASSGSLTKVEISKETYDKIQTGMTKAEVEAILGKANSVSESETPGVGKMEMHHYQKGFETKAIDVFFLDGKVHSKNWTAL